MMLPFCCCKVFSKIENRGCTWLAGKCNGLLDHCFQDRPLLYAALTCRISSLLVEDVLVGGYGVCGEVS
jgi:hypothetical protein